MQHTAIFSPERSCAMCSDAWCCSTTHRMNIVVVTRLHVSPTSFPGRSSRCFPSWLCLEMITSRRIVHKCIGQLVQWHRDSVRCLTHENSSSWVGEICQTMFKPARKVKVLCLVVTVKLTWPRDLRCAVSHVSPSSWHFFVKSVAPTYPHDTTCASDTVRLPKQVVKEDGR